MPSTLNDMYAEALKKGHPANNYPYNFVFDTPQMWLSVQSWYALSKKPYPLYITQLQQTRYVDLTDCKTPMEAISKVRQSYHKITGNARFVKGDDGMQSSSVSHEGLLSSMSQIHSNHYISHVINANATGYRKATNLPVDVNKYAINKFIKIDANGMPHEKSSSAIQIFTKFNKIDASSDTDTPMNISSKYARARI